MPPFAFRSHATYAALLCKPRAFRKTNHNSIKISKWLRRSDSRKRTQNRLPIPADYFVRLPFRQATKGGRSIGLSLQSARGEPCGI